VVAAWRTRTLLACSLVWVAACGRANRHTDADECVLRQEKNPIIWTDGMLIAGFGRDNAFLEAKDAVARGIDLFHAYKEAGDKEHAR